MSAAAEDLFHRAAELGRLPEDVLAGLELLASSPPLWVVSDRGHWLAIVDRAKAFALGCDREARACGWGTLQLWGVNRHAPGRLDAMGAGLFVAKGGRQVAAVAADAIELKTALGTACCVGHFRAEARSRGSAGQRSKVERNRRRSCAAGRRLVPVVAGQLRAYAGRAVGEFLAAVLAGC